VELTALGGCEACNSVAHTHRYLCSHVTRANKIWIASMLVDTNSEPHGECRQ
jgi:coenzyme F420-reducing hydrogenase gamma subunit